MAGLFFGFGFQIGQLLEYPVLRGVLLDNDGLLHDHGLLDDHFDLEVPVAVVVDDLASVVHAREDLHVLLLVDDGEQLLLRLIPA